MATLITVRHAAERGCTSTDWLDSRHTFSFAGYYDPVHTGFRALRVINDDRVLPASGFAMHGHRDMEIITYVLAGALEHRDSLGTGSVVRPNDVQRMSAGTGISHSEWNHSDREPVHFLQIWILPERRGLPPGYEQKHFAPLETKNRFRLVVSPDGRDGSITIHQDMHLYVGCFDQGERATFDLGAGRHAWVHIARGAVDINGVRLSAGDGAAISEEKLLELRAANDAEVLLFDLA